MQEWKKQRYWTDATLNSVLSKLFMEIKTTNLQRAMIVDYIYLP